MQTASRSSSVEAASQRGIGVLLHPTALPDSPVCGGFGAAARAWLTSLARHGISVWQVLPVAPTDGTGSPYSSPSSFAINPWLLDAQDLVDQGFLPCEAMAALLVKTRPQGMQAWIALWRNNGPMRWRLPCSWPGPCSPRSAMLRLPDGVLLRPAGSRTM